MLRRQLFMLAALLLLTLVAWIWMRMPGAGNGREPRGADRFPFAVADIVSMVLKNRHGTLLVGKRRGEWWLNQPNQTYADQGAIRQLINVTRDSIVHTAHEVQHQNLDLSQLGLVPAQAELHLESRTGEVLVLRAGERSQFDRTVPVLLSTNHALLWVSEALGYQLEQSAFHLRDKRVVSVMPAQIAAIEVTCESQPDFRLERRDKLFYLHSQQKTQQADTEAALATLTLLAEMRARQFLVERGKPLSKRDWDPTHAICQLVVETFDEQRWVIQLGTRPMKQQQPLATLLPRGPVVRLTNGRALAHLRSCISSLKNRPLLDFDPGAVTKIELQGTSVTIQLERQSADNGQTFDWFMRHPRKGKAKDAIVYAFLHKLSRLRALPTTGNRDLTSTKTTDQVFSEHWVLLSRMDGESIGKLFIGRETADRISVRQENAKTAGFVGRDALLELSFEPAFYLEDEWE